MSASALPCDAPPIQGLCVFDTAIGPCGIAWGANGIVGAQLPEPGAGATAARLQQRFPHAQVGAVPPPEVRLACAGVVALLRGEVVTLDDVKLDLTGVATLHRRVYALARAVRPGCTTTYGELARQLGDASLARAVGQALARNPYAPIVPCHRVLAAGGQAGGFSAAGGLNTKLRLLSIEGATFGGGRGLFDSGAGSA